MAAAQVHLAQLGTEAGRPDGPGREGLRWFFRTNRTHVPTASPPFQPIPPGPSDLPPLATRDIGTVPWEQALNARVFLLREALRHEPGNFADFVRARRGARVPTVLSL